MNAAFRTLASLLLLTLLGCDAEIGSVKDVEEGGASLADAALASDADELDTGDGLVADEVTEGTDTTEDGGVSFTFAILADPHLDRHTEHRAYLVRAVERLIAERETRPIELVFVLGDIAWGETEGESRLADARSILERLETAGMHYVPVLGDNEVQAGDERVFDEVFGPQYAALAEVLADWQKMSTPSDGRLLQSFSFEHRGCHFVSPDFISRVPGDEAATLHDDPEGSWPWFLADIAAAATGPAERISLLTHHGLFRTGIASADRYLISEADMTTVAAELCPYRDHIAVSYGGHIHRNWYWDVPCPTGERIYEVWITDDAHDAVAAEADDDRITIRLVDVIPTPDGFTYEQQLIEESTRLE